MELLFSGGCMPLCTLGAAQGLATFSLAACNPHLQPARLGCSCKYRPSTNGALRNMHKALCTESNHHAMPA